MKKSKKKVEVRIELQLEKSFGHISANIYVFLPCETGKEYLINELQNSSVRIFGSKLYAFCGALSLDKKFRIMHRNCEFDLSISGLESAKEFLENSKIEVLSTLSEVYQTFKTIKDYKIVSIHSIN